MDKRVIFAVAGSGKTTYLINQLDDNKKFLILTYTLNNVFNLRKGIVEKFGYFPENIKLFSYFSFLYSFCYKPFFNKKNKTRGITYKLNDNRYIKSGNIAYYINKNNQLYSNRIAKFLLNSDEIENITLRISKYFDYILIDEIQDLGGNDFNFLKKISSINIEHLYVGDFFQHTFDTSRDGNTNKNLHNNYDDYIHEFQQLGLTIDELTLSKSYRCSPTICDFITDKLKIDIGSHKDNETKIEFIHNQNIVNMILNNSNIIKLFYKEHYKYGCYSRNWGECKGDNNHFDIAVILNKATFEKYKKDKLNELNPQTLNKLYVALSRANNNVYIIPHYLVSKE